VKVLQKVGRLAGTVVDMPFAEATACLACGTAGPVDQNAEAGSRPDAPPLPSAPRSPVAVEAPGPDVDRSERIREVLAMASDKDVRFLTFKSAAVAVLGPDAPAKKGELIAALEALLG
jgi:hypothetical protein